MFKKLSDYIKASIEELRKVSWPTRRVALRLTMVVVVFSVFLAAYIGLFDFIFRSILQKLILKG